MTKPVVLIAEELSPATVEALGPDFEIRHVDGADRAALLPAIVDVDAILVRSATKVDAEAIAAAKKLKVVARAGVGLDNVDVKAATQAGVMVVNAPTSNIVSAAELAVALLLASARNIAPASQALKDGQWKRSKYTGVELTDKTVGVVGLGRIGLLVAQRLSAFGVKLVAYDPYVQPARAAQLGIRMLPLDELLAESDFITVHLPKTPETVGLIGEEALRKVKPTVRIINAARGGIVDEHALYVAIKEGRVAGAGLDVFATEPCTDSPLFEFEQVVATPHLGACTDEAQEKAGIAVARSVRLALAGELVPDAVNVKGGSIAEAVRPGHRRWRRTSAGSPARWPSAPLAGHRGRGARRGRRPRREDPRALRAQGRLLGARRPTRSPTSTRRCSRASAASRSRSRRRPSRANWRNLVRVQPDAHRRPDRRRRPAR